MVLHLVTSHSLEGSIGILSGAARRLTRATNDAPRKCDDAAAPEVGGAVFTCGAGSDAEEALEDTQGTGVFGPREPRGSGVRVCCET